MKSWVISSEDDHRKDYGVHLYTTLRGLAGTIVGRIVKDIV